LKETFIQREAIEMASKRKTKKASTKSKKKASKIKKTKKAAPPSKKMKPKPVAKVTKGKARKVKAAPAKVRKGQISRSEKAGTVGYEAKGLGAASGGQSGDLQGISDIEGAASESVQELLEEGSSFEAEVVAGVEGAADADEREVRTHEVKEDDVPEEYLERDR
jgi:hypothetical protein